MALGQCEQLGGTPIIHVRLVGILLALQHESQLAEQFGSRREPVVGRLGHHPLDHQAERLGQFRAKFTERSGLLLDVLHGDAQGRFALKRRAAGEHEIARHAE